MSTLVNPGTTPKVYSTEGHTIAAGERIEDVTLDAVGQGAVDNGRLRVLDEKKSTRGRNGAKSKAEPETASKSAPPESTDADSDVPPARRSPETPS